MSSIFFTPGPSQLYPNYTKHLQTALDNQLGSINHRSESFREIYKHTDKELRKLMNIPDSHAIFFAGSATEILERMILNLVEKETFHLVNGSFSAKFFQFAQQLQKSPNAYKVQEGQGFDISNIQIPNSCELICTTQNETSTGVQIPIKDLVELKQRYPSSLLCTDLVSTAPYADIDYNLMDSAFFSVQKAFGMPPGLGVWIVNQSCIEKSNTLHKKGFNQGAHHTLASFVKNYEVFETPSTPNVVAIYILGKIAEDMNQIGIEQIRQTLKLKANMIYDFVDHHHEISPFVIQSEHRSDTVAVINTQNPAKEILNALKERGLMIGGGYGSLKDHQIRIANFPATSVSEMSHLLETLGSIL